MKLIVSLVVCFAVSALAQTPASNTPATAAASETQPAPKIVSATQRTVSTAPAIIKPFVRPVANNIATATQPSVDANGAEPEDTSSATVPVPTGVSPIISKARAVKTVDANIEGRSVNSAMVGEVHLKPLYITTIHLPEPVTTIAVGAPTLFNAEHFEGEPNLVIVKPTTHDEAESNLIIALQSGATVSLKLVSSGVSGSKHDVDFVLDYRNVKNLLAFASPDLGGSAAVASALPSGITQRQNAVTAAVIPISTNRLPLSMSMLDDALQVQATIATPHWMTADDLLKVAKQDKDATRAIAVALGQVVEIGDTMMVSYSVMNITREYVQLLVPQIESANPVQRKPSKKGVLAAFVSIQDFRQNGSRLAPGARIDGVVQFSKPNFKESQEALLLHMAISAAVDHPVMVPLPFVAPGF